MRFLLFDPPILTTQVIALSLTAAFFAIALYWRGELRASGRARCVLACLRTVTFLLIGLLLLNPVIIRSAAGGQRKARFVLLVDVSRSMGVRDVEGGSRFDAVRQALLRNESLMQRLAALWEVQLYTFSEKAERTDLEHVIKIGSPTGERTELGDALIRVASQAGRKVNGATADSSGGERSAGALLVSDGRDNGSLSPLAAAKVAREAGMPVWTLCYGTEKAAKDIAVLTYATQNFAFARQRTTLSADVQQKGYGATSLTVTLERNGIPTTQQAITFPGDGRQTVRFPVTEASPGIYKYTVSTRPRQDEINTRNNSRSLFLRVTNNKVRVLLVDARPSWDTKFLSQTLRQDPNVEFTGVYRLSSSRDFSVTTGQHTTDNTQRPTRETSPNPQIRLPRRAEELFPYDVVIIGKGFEDLLTEAGVDMLKRYLLERGGSVVFFRGKADKGIEKLRDLEPIVWSSEEVRNLQLTLTEDGRQNPAFAFPGTEEPQSILRKLPNLLSATRVQKDKSFAVVLARSAGGEGLSEPMTAVVYQRYGAGRVMVIAGQGLWQWAFLPDELAKYDKVYRSFWAQMLRWLVGGSDFLPGRDVSLKTDQLSYVPGQQVHLLVYSHKAPGAKLDPKLEVVGPEGTRVAISPSRSSAFGATFVGTYTPQRTGDYTAVLRTGPRESDRLETWFTVFESRQEDIVTEADPQLMRQIAAASGGSVVTVQSLPKLVGQVREAEKRTLLREQPVSVWDRPWVLLLLCTLFGTEWYVRRRRGLC